MRPSPPEPVAKFALGPRQTLAELRELQRLALATIRHPLSRSGRTQSRWVDGRPMRQVAATFVKPNDRLTSLERLEIYNKQYWYRVMDCLWEDYPGVRAILGDRRFEALRLAYLNRYPSRSYTMRNLGSRLVQFMQEEPQYVAPRGRMCADMARFEWAQVVAFDGETRKPLCVDDLLGQDPARLRLGLQPYLTLLEMAYPLDEYVIALKRKDAALRTEASNAMARTTRRSSRHQRPRLPASGNVFLAIHRHENQLYYKRLDPPAFRILAAIRDGATLADACASAVGQQDGSDEGGDVAARIQEWFTTWTELGWFCRPPRR